jgi:signal transduction histidine kinase
MTEPIRLHLASVTGDADRDARRLDELAFLHEIARLATLARDWDELMRSIVDGTTEAMGVEVCSFYLADHERTRLTLAATNGLDRTQVGKVSLPWGTGITGRVAANRQPIAVVDVTKDERFSWVRGFDIEGLTAMLSVPLVWHDDVVGVLNVQTRDARRFEQNEISFLQTIAALLAGIVEKGRLTAEVEARLAQLTALDAARAELLSVVTHELRTPLSVVRVYVDLLGEAADLKPAETASAEKRPTPADGEDVEGWHDAAIEQLGRLDRLVDSILASVRGEGLTGLSRAPFDAVRAVDETVETLRLLLRPRPIRWERPPAPQVAIGDEGRFRQVLEQLLENESKYAPSAEGVSIGIWRVAGDVQVYVTDDGPGVPIEDWESVFEPFVRIEGRGRSRGSGIGLFAARRLMHAMGGRVFLEPNGYGGSRFVVALPADG